MTANAKEYERLPGRRRTTLLSRVSLWLGPDHVLKVRNRGYSEEYRRFYYRDIQAIVFRTTSQVYTTGIILGVFVLFFAALLAIGLSRSWEAGLLRAIGGAGVLFLIPLIVHIVRGPTCRCQIRTAVQTEELESLTRVRPAVKAIDRIRSRVEAAQGSISGDELFRRGQPME